MITGYGDLLRTWRKRRHLSQQELASLAEVSTRHLSFLETGRSQPSRPMVLRLARSLDVPLRERNAMLHAAGFAEAYRARGLDDEGLAPIRDALTFLLAQHEPWPAVLVDRHWDVLMTNGPALRLVREACPSLPPPTGLNMLRIVFDEDHGVRRALRNFEEVAASTLELLRLEALAPDATPKTRALYAELRDLAVDLPEPSGQQHLLLPLELDTAAGELSLFTAITTLGTPRDVFLSELRMETYFPANPETAAILRSWQRPLRNS